MTGGTIKRGLSNIFNPGMTLATLVVNRGLSQVMHAGTAVFTCYLSRVAGFTGRISRH